MNDANQRSFLTDFYSSKLKLPNIRRIKIQNIQDRNKKLTAFLQNWVPSKLDLFLVNFPYNSRTEIKMDFYIGSISKSIILVTKEIYLWCFEIKESELEWIIKSASNWERLILRFSDIHCSRKLDFSVSVKCKIKFLSFYNCGFNNSKERKTDWISTPSTFKNIVEAISRSKLKDSLEEVDISGNDTLDKNEAQAMFDELKMPHISVVEIGPSPIK